MRFTRRAAGSRAARGPACWFAGAVLLAGLSGAPRAAADIFRLHSGGVVEGQLIARDEQAYTIRTVVGTVVLPLTAVTAVEPAASPFDEYDARLRELPDTAAAHVELAAWCRENELAAEQRRHLARALELDPDCAAARAALGHVRVGGAWVDGRSRPEPPPTASDSANADRDARDGKLVAAMHVNWHRRIRGIRSAMLESRVERREAEGRKQILAIRDPLAILPLTQVLGSGNHIARAALVDALAGFPQDEATLNLAVLALSDGAADIRSRALEHLALRNDTRVSAQLRKALGSDNDELIRRAAIGLGALGAVEAVPDLIEELTVKRTKRVEVPIRTYFGEFQQAFCTPTEYVLNGAARVAHAPRVGVFDATGGVTVENVFRVQRVTVYRTEVLEALKTLTGQNFGFDATAWRTWYEEHRS